MTQTATCTNPDHGHTTTVDHDGFDVPEQPMLCNHCKLPTHYDYGVEDYAHDDPEAPACFLVGEYIGSLCSTEAN